jgi:hypothetical protein
MEQAPYLHDIESSAKRIPMPAWTLRAHIKAGNIKVTRLGKRIMLATSELERIAREGLPSLRTERSK